MTIDLNLSVSGRVLVFEDDFLLAGTLADVLARLGCKWVACVGSFDQAMVAAETQICDLAVVDLDLRGHSAAPILDKLIARAIPYILATCTARSDIPSTYAAAPCISKPYNLHALGNAIQLACGKDPK